MTIKAVYLSLSLRLFLPGHRYVFYSKGNVEIKTSVVFVCYYNHSSLRGCRFLFNESHLPTMKSDFRKIRGLAIQNCKAF